MIYEWRIYEVMPGKMNVLHNLFEKTILKLFKEYDIKVVGFWETIVGTSNILYYMVAFEDVTKREKAWDAFYSDPEWLKAWKETSKIEGPLTERVVNMLLKPTSYSPMK